MPGYKMKNGSKNYMIKSYRDGGLVETKKYEDGKTVVTEDERMKAMQQFLNEDTSREDAKKIVEDSKKNPDKYMDLMGVPIKKPVPK
tara:strand:+ start:733 stop:993 length:261 start_codon:yes stop_codon:yes gene_type:complete